MSEHDRQNVINKLHDAETLLLELARITTRWKAPVMALGALYRVTEELSSDMLCPVCDGKTIVDITDGGATPCPLCAYFDEPDTLDELPF